MKIMYFLIRQNALSICRQHIRADNFWRRRTTFGSGGQLFRLTHQSRQAFHQTTRHNFTSGHRLCKNDTHAFTWISRRNMATNFQNRDEQRFYKILRRGVVIAVIGVFVYGALYFVIKAKREKDAQLNKSYGDLAIGGPWSLHDLDGKPIGHLTFRGQWYLLYFGFTHCPDICPEELEKITEVMNELSTNTKLPRLKTVFVTVDPERDTPGVMRKYCEEFHDDLVGATGTRAEIQRVCQTFRVYYSKGPVDSDGDYIVDHTIIFYLVNPDGRTEQYYGQLKTKDDIVKDITERILKREHDSSLLGQIQKLLGLR